MDKLKISLLHVFYSLECPPADSTDTNFVPEAIYTSKHMRLTVLQLLRLPDIYRITSVKEAMLNPVLWFYKGAVRHH